MPDGSRSLPGRPNLRYLSLRVRGNRTRVVLTSRLIPVNTIADRLQRSRT